MDATPIRRLRIRAEGHCGRRKQANAEAWLAAFEDRVLVLDRASRETPWLMSHDGSNEGRGTSEGHGLVNGTEVRFSERWLIPSDPTVDYDTVYTVSADGTKTVWTPPSTDATDATPRKQASKHEHAADYFRRLALHGATETVDV